MDKEVMDKLTLVLAQIKGTNKADPQQFYEIISSRSHPELDRQPS